MVIRLVLLGILAAASYLLSLLGFLGIGLIIDDHYIFASKDARKQMNKRAYSLQSAIFFLCIGTMFLLIILRVLSGMMLFSYIARFLCIAALIYTIVSHYAIRNSECPRSAA